MSYGLGIDLGNSCATAAISRTRAAGADVEVVPLDPTGSAVSAVLHLGEDGSLLVGTAAEHHVHAEPDRIFRGFVRRVGEGGGPPDGPIRPEELTAWLVRWVVDVLIEQQGAPPDRIALSHPPSWNPRGQRIVEDALAACGIEDVLFVPAPVAAVTGWIESQGGELADGDTVAVYNLGDTLDAAVIARTPAGDVTQLGIPRTLDHIGGPVFDEIVFAHVLEVLGDRVAAADLDDVRMLEGMARLLEECVAAREGLSDSSSVSIPVTLPGLNTSVELTRSEFEAMIRFTLLDGVDALRGAVADAGLTVPELDCVLVTGGVAATPLVAALLADELDRPILLPDDPLRVGAIGAAVAASGQWGVLSPSTVESPAPGTATASQPVFAQPTDPSGATSTGAAALLAHPVRRRSRQRRALAAAAGAVAVVAVVIPLTVIPGSKADAGWAAEQGRGETLDNSGTVTSGETPPALAGGDGPGTDTRRQPQVVSTSGVVSAVLERAAPPPVVPVTPRSVPAPPRSETLAAPPPPARSGSDQPVITATPPPRGRPITPLPPRPAPTTLSCPTSPSESPPLPVSTPPAPPTSAQLSEELPHADRARLPRTVRGWVQQLPQSGQPATGTPGCRR